MLLNNVKLRISLTATKRRNSWIN